MKSWMSRIKGLLQNAKTVLVLLANVTKSARVRMEHKYKLRAHLSKPVVASLISAKRKLIEFTLIFVKTFYKS